MWKIAICSATLTFFWFFNQLTDVLNQSLFHAANATNINVSKFLIQQLSGTTLITLEDEPAAESSTDPTSEDTTQNHNTPSQNPNQVPQTPPPDYSPSWHGVDAYRPRPVHSERPPIPQGIPPPPYQGLQSGPVPSSTQQSISDEPPPEYPGPPRVFNPAAPVQYPPGSRLALALEQERRREIWRLIVL